MQRNKASPEGLKESFHSEYYEQKYDTDEEDNEDKMASDGDLFSSSDEEPPESVSSRSISVSLAKSASLNSRNQQEQHYEGPEEEEGEIDETGVSASSLSTFSSEKSDSSSSGSSSVSPSEYQSLTENLNDERGSSSNNNTESAKLRRILYGSSMSSSFSEEEYVDGESSTTTTTSSSNSSNSSSAADFDDHPDRIATYVSTPTSSYDASANEPSGEHPDDAYPNTPASTYDASTNEPSGKHQEDHSEKYSVTYSDESSEDRSKFSEDSEGLIDVYSDAHSDDYSVELSEDLLDKQRDQHTSKNHESEFGYITKNRDKTNPGVEVEAENGSDRTSMDGTAESSKGTKYSMSSSQRRSDPPPSASLGMMDSSENESDVESTESEESFPSWGRNNYDQFSQRGSSNSESKVSESRRDYEQSLNDARIRNNEASTPESDQRRTIRWDHNNDPAMTISPSSTNFSMDSRSNPRGSSSKSSRINSSPSEKRFQPRTASHKNMGPGVNGVVVALQALKKSITKPSPDAEPDPRVGSANSASKSKTTKKAQRKQFPPNFSISIANPSPDPESNPNLRSKTVSKAERKKQSTIWAGTGDWNEGSYGRNDAEGDEVGWKPPALTTFSRSNYYELTDDHRNKRDPTAHVVVSPRSKQQQQRPVHTRKKSAQAKKAAKNALPPPIPEVVTGPSDDDSTLGTEGTYLERFPKKKAKQKEVLNRLISPETEIMRIVRNTEIPRERYSGSSKGKNDSKSSEMFERSTSNRRKLFIPKRPGYVTQNKIPYGSSSNAFSDTGSGIPNHISGGTDPPGDAFLFSYEQQKQQALFGSSVSTRDDSSDIMEKQNSIPESSSASGKVVPPSEKPKERLRSPPKPMSSWVPPSMVGKGVKVDLDPTRTFVEALISNRRSSSSPWTTMHELRIQQRPPRPPRPPISQAPQISEISSTIDRGDVSSKAESEFSMPHFHDSAVTDTSRSTIPKSSRSAYRRDQMSTSGSSMSRNSYSVAIFSDSQAMMSQDNHVSRTKILPSQSHSSSVSEASSSAYDMDEAVRKVQASSALSANPKYSSESMKRSKKASIDADNTISSSSSSSSPLATEEDFRNETDPPESPGRSRKMTVRFFYCWAFAVLIVAGGIVVVVLWRMGILFAKPVYTVTFSPTSSPTLVPSFRPSPLPTNLPTKPPTKPPTPKPSMPLTHPPTIAPTTTSLFTSIIEAFPEGKSALEDPDSPQTKALKWLEESSKDDLFGVQNYLQRYALATVYYSTNGDDWIDSRGWLSEEDECDWMSTAQNICDESGNIVKLELKENNLVGTLPAELGILSDTLRTINIRNNTVSGAIPSRMVFQLTNLEVLDLSSNKFSGLLTRELFDATSLTRLSLFENNLSSSIPSELGLLTKLDVLDLGSNQLTSTIPTTIALLSNLAGLSLFNNTLTGTVPIELSSIQNLQMLYIDSNDLEAPLPLEVCLLDIREFWGDCEEIQCICCTTCCSNNFGCYVV